MLATINEIINDLRKGKIIILADDEQRENEGDMIFAAEAVNAELINFMMVHARGLICLTLTEQRCHHLQLPLMPTRNQEKGFQTAFTVSIEAANGVTTGISASDRAKTIATAISPTAKANDLVTPGHIFPLMAKPGGVLERPGHTEAGCDLTKLAGLIPAAVICEITLPDGSMARMPDLQKFSQIHNIRLSTVEQLIKFRLSNEIIIKRLNQHPIAITTAYGQTHCIEYLDCITNHKHVALVYGNNMTKADRTNKEAEIYTHFGNQITDWFYKTEKNETWCLEKALQYFSKKMENNSQDNGVILILNEKLSSAQIAKNVAIDKKSTKINYSMIDGLRKQICTDLGIKKLHILNS